MPPPSLSDPTTLLQQQEIANFTHHHRRRQKGSGNSLDNEDPFTMDEYDEDDDEEDDEDSTVDFSPPSSLSPPTDEKHTSWTVSSTTTDDNPLHKDRPTIYSFTKSHTPSTSTTTSYVLSSSPPDQDRNKWIHTLAKLRQSIVVSQPTITSPSVSSSRDFIPMPPPPRRKRSRRRSEATTQPRFNFDTKTYTRDTRSNPDHLRMIAAELNMMRARKLFSPLKPRGFLPRRKDPFICGDGRPQSPLIMEIAIDT
ncbi:hypothetical protein BC941DRAFT_434144 [Chlamydoabsidia padenii]|nr:hypothetical protein BC941DRAFT_434144 [Chlamydoabsidia padenii]